MRKHYYRLTLPFFWLSTVIILTVGTLFVMWLGEKITDKGLGNGTSIIIMIGILATLAAIFYAGIFCKANPWRWWTIDIHGGNSHSYCHHLRVDCFGAGGEKDPGKLCKTNCWQQAIWRCQAISSIESKCSRCYAYYFCAGDYVPAYYLCRFSNIRNRLVIIFY